MSGQSQWRGLRCGSGGRSWSRWGGRGWNRGRTIRFGNRPVLQTRYFTSGNLSGALVHERHERDEPRGHTAADGLNPLPRSQLGHIKTLRGRAPTGPQAHSGEQKDFDDGHAPQHSLRLIMLEYAHTFPFNLRFSRRRNNSSSHRTFSSSRLILRFTAQSLTYSHWPLVPSPRRPVHTHTPQCPGRCRCKAGQSPARWSTSEYCPP